MFTLNFDEDRTKKPSQTLSSSELTPCDCLYERNTRFTEDSFNALKVLLKSIEGVASVTLKDDYSVRIKIGSLFFSSDVQRNIRKALNIK